jgi:hypothetical protein
LITPKPGRRCPKTREGDAPKPGREMPQNQGGRCPKTKLNGVIIVIIMKVALWLKSSQDAFLKS